MKIEQIQTEKLIPYARNSKLHSEAQVGQIAASIRAFGFNNPVLIDKDNGIIAGHGRVLGAQKLGIESVPCLRLSHLTDIQKRAYIIADNRLSETGGGWDTEMLALEIEDLRLEDFDIDLTGFDADALEEMFDFEDEPNEGLTDEDEVPEPPAEPITKPGDVWILGNHRVMCGDSTDASVVGKLMESETATLCFTSPPYGNQRDYKTGGISDWDALMQGVFAQIPMAPDGQVLVNLGLIHQDNEWIPYWDGWIEWMRSHGWRRFGFYAWDQGPGLPGDWNGRLAPSHEVVFHFNKLPRKPNKIVESKHAGETLGGGGLRSADGTVKQKTGAGDAIQSHKIPDSVFRIMRHKGGLGDAGSHPAVFPIALPEFVIEAYSEECDIIFEPFGGSGTTMLACEKTDRRCRIIELAPEYCDVIVKRWQDFTGKTAILESTGEPFPS